MTVLLQEIKNIKSGKKELRQFGLSVGAVLLIIAAWLLWKQRPAFIYFAALGSFLIGSGVLLPIVLKPLFRVWMTFGVVMSFVMTRVILSILYFGVFTPTALVLKLFRKDLLEERWDKAADSYWAKRQPPPYEPETTERMF
jgi:hypothetical protein